MVCLWTVPKSHMKANCRYTGIFFTFFLLLVVISFGEEQIRIANQRFILPVAALMMLLATTVGPLAP